MISPSRRAAGLPGKSGPLHASGSWLIAKKFGQSCRQLKISPPSIRKKQAGGLEIGGFLAFGESLEQSFKLFSRLRTGVIPGGTCAAERGPERPGERALFFGAPGRIAKQLCRPALFTLE